MGANSPGTTDITVRGFVLGPVQTNCYVVRAGPGKGCWIVDAGYQPGQLIAHIRREQLEPEAVVLTHAHADHIGGVREVLDAFPGTPLWIHEAERSWLGDPELNLSAMMDMSVTAPPPDAILTNGQELRLGDSRWRVLHTPGHSPGGITLHCPDAHLALVGDALFAGSIGRTDFPGSSFETLARAIREKLYTLPPDTKALPGHGPATTIGRERQSNPFVRAQA